MLDSSRSQVAQELDSDIVIPDVGFFTQSSGSATETTDDNGSALWIEARTLAEQDLKNRGATDIELVQDFPVHRCGLFRVTMDGSAQSVVVSMAGDKSFELPAELLQNESASASATSSPTQPQHLLLISSPAGSSKELSVALFQPNWNAAGRPSLLRFDVPRGHQN